MTGIDSPLCTHCAMPIYREGPVWLHKFGAQRCGPRWAEPAVVAVTAPTLAERDQARAIAVELEQQVAFLTDEVAALQRALTECQQRAAGWYMAAHQLGGGS